MTEITDLLAAIGAALTGAAALLGAVTGLSRHYRHEVCSESGKDMKPPTEQIP